MTTETTLTVEFTPREQRTTLEALENQWSELDARRREIPYEGHEHTHEVLILAQRDIEGVQRKLRGL